MRMNYEPLQFEYEALQGQRLASISGFEPLHCSDGSTAYDNIVIALDRDLLMVSVNNDTDEIMLQTARLDKNHRINEKNNIKSLSKFIGKELGWCWVGRNWLGYADTFTISFEGLEPQIVLYCMASKLSIYRTQKL